METLMGRTDGDSPRYYFESKIRLKCYNDRYISATEEAELIEFAGHNLTPPMSADEATAFILAWAREHEVVVESEALRHATFLLRRSLADDGRIDQREFEAVVDVVRQETRSRMADESIRSRLKAIMNSNGWRAKGDGLFGPRWFGEISG